MNDDGEEDQCESQGYAQGQRQEDEPDRRGFGDASQTDRTLSDMANRRIEKVGRRGLGRVPLPPHS